MGSIVEIKPKAKKWYSKEVTLGKYFQVTFCVQWALRYEGGW